MVSGIDESVNASENPRPRFNPTSMTPVDNSITTPTPATEHAPKGFITDDSARGTIFWEAEANGTAEPKDPEDETHTGETTESDDQLQPEQEEGEAAAQSLGHPFKIEWLSTVKLPFHRARGLRNPWNQNREVKIARDGTEMEPSVGRKLIDLFHTSAEAPVAPAPQPQLHYPPPPNPTAYPPYPPFGWSY
jgi:YT521-B-like domain